MRSIVIAFLFSIITHTCFSQQVKATISGIRNSNGQIVIAVFDSHDSFEKKKSVLVKRFDKTQVKNGVLHVQFDLKAGEYGFSLLDDENKNALMDYNVISLPKEGFGFSNYYHSGFSQPKYKDFKVEIKENESNQIKIKIRYL